MNLSFRKSYFIKIWTIWVVSRDSSLFQFLRLSFYLIVHLWRCHRIIVCFVSSLLFFLSTGTSCPFFFLKFPIDDISSHNIFGKYSLLFCVIFTNFFWNIYCRRCYEIFFIYLLYSDEQKFYIFWNFITYFTAVNHSE